MRPGPLRVIRYRFGVRRKSLYVGNAPKADANHREDPFAVDGIALDVIQAPKLEHRIMRYELSNYEWSVIKPTLPKKSRGIPVWTTGAFSIGTFATPTCLCGCFQDV